MNTLLLSTKSMNTSDNIIPGLDSSMFSCRNESQVLRKKEAAQTHLKFN
jgi:hypothetical protein